MTELAWAPALPIPQPGEVWQSRDSSDLAYVDEAPCEENGYTVRYRQQTWYYAETEQSVGCEPIPMERSATVGRV